MLTVTGVRLYKWFEMGIFDLEDLQWLLKFYHNEDLPLALVGAALSETRDAWPEKLGRPTLQLLTLSKR